MRFIVRTMTIFTGHQFYILRLFCITSVLFLAIQQFCGCLVAAPTPTQESKRSGIEHFESSIRPLLVRHCYECHSGLEASGGLQLDTRDNTVRGGDSGVVILPGNPDSSLLIHAVRYRNPELKMPPKHRLTEAEVKSLERWIAEGAPDPRNANAFESAQKPIGMSIENGRTFWSLRSAVKIEVPQVQNQAWVRSPIDAFVLARLDAGGVEPAPPADKRTLIRRLSYDLIGLPPTPQEINSFLADEAPDAYEKLVERLLSSTAYGVRWGRHWLDVVRYADSNGLDENLAFGNAWRYRDYVVDAFNSDKPFDHFLVEQIAGDLIKDANRDSKTATGFLMLGAKILAEPDREKLEMDTIDEQLDTMGKVFLGMTFGCVRCHDHKFDPIKQTDYYALAAIFKSTKTFDGTNMGAIKHWHEYLFGNDEEILAIKEIEKSIAEKKGAIASFKSKAVERLQTDSMSKAVDYLLAAVAFDLETPLTEIVTIAKPKGLHPHILHHCRRHLANRREDPVLGHWHAFAEKKDLTGLEMHFRPLFAEALAAMEATRKTDPKASAIDDPRLQAIHAVLVDKSGFLAIPSQPQFAFDAETYAQYSRLCEESRLFESNAADVFSVMGVTDGTITPELPIHIRGSHHNFGKSVSRGFPEVMHPSNANFELPNDHSGRLELAHWMASKQHPLTSRVLVNRVWGWHFGTALVPSTENFGTLGDRPSHPELLDWLAHYFMDNGWSIKDLHRLILSSSTYQMSSSHPENAKSMLVDAESRLRWKFPLQRLDAEQIRDAVLAVAGRLDESLGGKSIPLRNRQFVFDHTSIDHTKYDGFRRSLYLPVIRNNLYTLFEQFDFPDPTTPTGHRNSTTVAPQSLLMMNSELIMDSANAFAERLSNHSNDNVSRIHFAYELAFGRQPTHLELQRAIAFVEGVQDTANGEQSSKSLWSFWCQALLASNEFLYIR